MRALIVIATIFALLRTPLLGDPCLNDPTSEQLAKFLREASDQKAPLPEGKLVVPTAEVAQAIHAAVAGAFWGAKLVEGQRPFKAVRSGEVWVVYGCVPPPKDPNIAIVGGVAVTVIRALDGKVVWITGGQ